MGPTVTVSDEHRNPDQLLARAGIGADTDRDQHFLIDARVLDRIAGYGADLPGSSGTILEIGAGTGALTDRLLTIADHVIAIEVDHALATFLRREFAPDIDAGHLEFKQGDALEVELPAFDAAVANLPYSAASEIIFRLLPYQRPMVLMVQREFAERLVAEPGTAEYGRLSVTAWWYADIELREVVPPTAFDPPPPVDSAVIEITPTESPADVSHDTFEALVRGVFTQRRKTLRNAIRNTTHISGIEDPAAVLEALETELLDRRPDAVTPTEYVAIARTVETVTDA